MRSLITLLLFLCIYFITYAQPGAPACNTFHTGQYLYTDSTGTTWELKRTKHHQTERNKRNGQVNKFTIRWLTDCEYMLTQTWTSDRTRRKWNRAHFSYRIVSSTEYSYSYTCACKDSPDSGGTVVRALY